MLIIILVSLKCTHNEFTIRISSESVCKHSKRFPWRTHQEPTQTRRTALICQINFPFDRPTHRRNKRSKKKSNGTDSNEQHKIHTLFCDGMFDLLTMSYRPIKCFTTWLGQGARTRLCWLIDDDADNWCHFSRLIFKLNILSFAIVALNGAHFMGAHRPRQQRHNGTTMTNVQSGATIHTDSAHCTDRDE